MAEAIAEVIGEAAEGIEGEAADAAGLGKEAAAEVTQEAAEATEATSKLGKVVEYFKGLKWGELAWTFSKFVMKNAAIGAIFYGTTVALKKIFATSPQGARGQSEQKYKKIKAISAFITSSSDLSKTVSDWLNSHKEDMITLDGISVPLISIFVKFTDPLGDVSAC